MKIKNGMSKSKDQTQQTNGKQQSYCLSTGISLCRKWLIKLEKKYPSKIDGRKVKYYQIARLNTQV